jgi:hypothetical protein
VKRRTALALPACAVASSWLAALALLPPSARAQEIEVIALRHRTAEQVLPLLRPFVDAGGALTGQGYQLFLRTTPSNARQIRQMLASLDRAPRQLVISVRQDRDGESASRSIGADGSVTTTNRRVHGNVGIEAHDTRTIGTTGATQTIRVLEGGRASIAIGTAIPMSFRQFVVTPHGLTEMRGTVFYDAVTGFHAQPQVAGDQVTIELSPEQTTLTATGTERAQLSTIVRGRLGEWIAVGGADVRSDSQTSGVLSSGQQSASQSRGVWLKVDEAGAQR